jgi:excisionase family DNA binding protein
VGQLAQYWSVSRKQIYKQIEAGTLNAFRLGPRLLRIRTVDALKFERSAKMLPEDRSSAIPDVSMKAIKVTPERTAAHYTQRRATRS